MHLCPAARLAILSCTLIRLLWPLEANYLHSTATFLQLHWVLQFLFLQPSCSICGQIIILIWSGLTAVPSVNDLTLVFLLVKLKQVISSFITFPEVSNLFLSIKPFSKIHVYSFSGKVSISGVYRPLLDL